MEKIEINCAELEALKVILIQEMKELFAKSSLNQKSEWLKGSEVKKLLKISPGTLQNFRTTGQLPYSKIGGILYYNIKDIYKILEDNKREHPDHIFDNSY